MAMRLPKIAELLMVFACVLVLTGAVSECDAGAVRDEPGWIPDVSGSGPEWSSDGTVMVFDTGHGAGPTGIYVVDAEGTWLHRVPEGPSAPRFFNYDVAPDLSPDGSRVVYSTLRYSTGSPWNRIHSWEIATSRPDGTDHRRLTKNKHEDDDPVWSPDGARIAFISDREAEADGTRYHVYTMAEDGSDVRRIAPGGKNGLPILLTWSPNGRYVAFEDRDRELHASNEPIRHFIATVSSDGSDFRRVFESESEVRSLVWSPDSRHLAFVVHVPDEVAIIETIGLDGLDRRELARFGGDESIWIDELFWSLDGSEIRFDASWPKKGGSDRTSYQSGVFAVNADGSNLRELTEGADLPWANLAWSPDGSRIAVRSRRPPLRFGTSGLEDVVLFTMAPDGSDKRILVRNALGEQLVAGNSDWQDVSTGIAACSEGEAVPDPKKNPGLVRDCETLLRIRDTLTGEDVALAWTADIPIREWAGIRVGGSPARVEMIEFAGYTLRSNTYLNGSIPAGLGDLSGLKSLMLGSQQLSGEIPPELGKLVKLERLILVDNRLTGSIPPELGDLANLRELLLMENELTGRIPPELGNLKNLKVLAVHKNNLTGCVPASLTNNLNLSINSGLKPC